MLDLIYVDRAVVCESEFVDDESRISPLNVSHSAQPSQPRFSVGKRRRPPIGICWSLSAFLKPNWLLLPTVGNARSDPK